MARNKNNIFIYIIAVIFFISCLGGCSITKSNWNKDSQGNITYTDEDDNKKTGFANIDNKPYFFDNDGNLIKEMKVVDVSKYQGDIDWNAVRSDGINIAMIRCSYGWDSFPKQVDPMFEKNIIGARSAGLKVGVYHYSYATNELEAIKEANYCLRAIAGYKIDFPIAYDLEEDGFSAMPEHKVSSIAATFCEKIRESGYSPMVYSKVQFLHDEFEYELIKPYDIWVAQYSSQCTYKYPYAMWQYTDSAKVSGISKNVDLSIYYFDKTIDHFKRN